MDKSAPIEQTVSTRPSPQETLSQSVQLAIAAVVSLLIYRWLGVPGAVWCIVSAILVLQPEVAASRSSALIRTKANILGAIVGALSGGSLGINVGSLAVAVFVGSLLCYWFRLETATKSACACAVIVMMAPGGSVWSNGEERVIAVAAGSAIALVLHTAFVELHRLFVRHIAKTKREPKPQIPNFSSSADES